MTLGAETLAIISLVALILTIAVAFWRKMNPGVLAFAVTLILAIIANIDTHTIIKGFNSNLFIILLGASFFASIAQINGTLHLLARKVVAMAGKRAWAVPFFMYFVGNTGMFLRIFLTLALPDAGTNGACCRHGEHQE